MLDDENTKKRTSNNNKNIESVTEELARSLMDHLYDELKKRSGELAALQQQYPRSNQRSDGERPAALDYPIFYIPGLWNGRDMEDSGVTLNEEASPYYEKPIPGMWGRGLFSRKTIEEKK